MTTALMASAIDDDVTADTRHAQDTIVERAAMKWDKRDDMIVRAKLPFNAEPPPSVLASSQITPVDAFYARNHGPFPHIAAGQWQLTVAPAHSAAAGVPDDRAKPAKQGTSSCT